MPGEGGLLEVIKVTVKRKDRDSGLSLCPNPPLNSISLPHSWSFTTAPVSQGERAGGEDREKNEQRTEEREKKRNCYVAPLSQAIISHPAFMTAHLNRRPIPPPSSPSPSDGAGVEGSPSSLIGYDEV